MASSYITTSGLVFLLENGFKDVSFQFLDKTYILSQVFFCFEGIIKSQSQLEPYSMFSEVRNFLNISGFIEARIYICCGPPCIKSRTGEYTVVTESTTPVFSPFPLIQGCCHGVLSFLL
jgi:hypothetical protein